MKHHYLINKLFTANYIENILRIKTEKAFKELKLKNLDNYCLQMYLKTLEINVLKYMNLILLTFYLDLY